MTRKKIGSILLILSMALTLIPGTALADPPSSPLLYVGGTNVPGGSTPSYWKAAAGGYSQDGASSADYEFSVSYDDRSEEFTLTLNGLQITQAEIEDWDCAYGIFASGSLHLVLEEGTENRVSAEGEDVSAAAGVYAGGALTIDGGGKLELSVAGSSAEGAFAAGIDAIGDITISGGEISVAGDPDVFESYGLRSDREIIVTDGSLSVSGVSCGLYAPASPYDNDGEGGHITISGGAVSITAENYGIKSDWGNVSLSGGRVIADVSDDSSWGSTCAVFTMGGNVMISGGTVLANRDGEGDYGIQTLYGTGISILGGAVYAYGGSCAAAVGQNDDVSHPRLGGREAGGKAVVIMTKGVEPYDPELLYHEDIRPEINAEAGGLSVGSFPFHKGGDWETETDVVYGDFSAVGAYTWSAAQKTSGAGRELFDLILNGFDITNYFLLGDTYGIYSAYDLDLTLQGFNTIGSGDNRPAQGIFCGDGSNLSVSSERGGSLAIEASFCGIQTDGSLTVSGGNTVLDVRAGNRIIARPDGISLFAPAPGSFGIRAGGTVAIADAAADICSRGTGILAADRIYFGYRWDGGAYVASGSPAVRINNRDRIAAIYDFEIGDFGVVTTDGDVFVAGGTLEAAGGVSAIRPGGPSGVNVTAAPYQYKVNVGAPSAPVTAYVEGAAAPFVNRLDYQYVEIRPAPQDDGGSGSGSGGSRGSETRTITVTEASSSLFHGAAGQIGASANMNNAFSNSVEVKVTDTNEAAASFGFGAGNQVYPFDISLYIKGTGTRTKPAPGYAVTISLPVPESLLDKKEQLAVMHKSDAGTVTTLASRLEQRNGVWYLVFEATEFSPYALVAPRAKTYDESKGVPYYPDDGGRVFIGFAAKGKYIAPVGAAVAVMPNGKDFADISGRWAEGPVGFVTEREIFLGTGNSRFSPDAGMTRAMFATVIGRLYERSYGEIQASGRHAFTDCSYGDYYGKYIDWASGNNIVDGYGGGRFGPNDPVTRQQMAVIIYRFSEFLGAMPADRNTDLHYPDSAVIAGYAQNAALYCQTTGIIAGRVGGMFAPRETASRAEAAAITERFIQWILE